jgi:hypothetical protein
MPTGNRDYGNVRISLSRFETALYFLIPGREVVDWCSSWLMIHSILIHSTVLINTIRRASFSFGRFSQQDSISTIPTQQRELDL